MPVEKLTRMPDPRIHLETDFNAAETRVSGEVGLSFRIGDLVSIGIAFAGPALKWFRAFRKVQKLSLIHILLLGGTVLTAIGLLRELIKGK